MITKKYFTVKINYRHNRVRSAIYWSRSNCENQSENIIFTCELDLSVEVVDLWSQTLSVQVQAADRQTDIDTNMAACHCEQGAVETELHFHCKPYENIRNEFSTEIPLIVPDFPLNNSDRPLVILGETEDWYASACNSVSLLSHMTDSSSLSMSSLFVVYVGPNVYMLP